MGGFLTANGSRDSHAIILADGTRNGSPRAGTPYRRISWAGIRELVERPGAVEKNAAPLVILSAYVEHDARTHDVQRARGVYGGLAVDIDKGDPSLDQVADALRGAVGDVAAMIYSSSSAEPGNRKWRILLPLAEPIAGADYADTQHALFGLLKARGIVCDPTLARSAQPVYLPNVPPKRRGPDGRPLFYRRRVVDGPRLDLADGSVVGQARRALRERRAEEESQAAVLAAANREQRLARVAATGDTFEPIEHFKQNHSVEQLLARYGFQRNPKGRGSHWKSPLSESGSYSTECRGDHWVTVSAWAHTHGIGRVSRTGHRYGDAFDLYVAFEHQGDRSAAVRTYSREVRPQRGPARLQDLPAVRVETHEPPAELVPIDQYRRDLQHAIAESVLDGTPGVRLLRGAPGTGKTTAVARAVARSESGVISVPGHELAGEIVEQLRKAGADAAAYPRLDETTCKNHEVASRAQAAGLSVAATVCPKCPLLSECRERGYLAGVKAADKAAHKVVTHARLSRSAYRLTKDARYLVLEEDPTTALRPTVSATRRELERLGDLADELADAERRWWILEGAESVADAVPEPVADFAAWAPEAVSESCNRLQDSPTADHHVDAPRRRTARAYPRGFFGSCCRIADELADALADAVLHDAPAGVRELQIRPAGTVPKNPEGEIWRGLQMLERFDPDATAGISGEALRLVLYVARGGSRVFLQVENDARPGATRRTAEVVAVLQTYLPTDHLPVYVNDGTLEADALARLAGGSVADITPSGSAPLLHAAVQYPHDITPSTSSAKVAAILTGIARANPDRERLGVILHQRHHRELVEAEDSPLPSDVRSRLAWATYFGSGADRGTNTLHKVADLAVVIGTYRPPPSEIRRTLLRWGELEAAGSTPTWGRVDRRSPGADGAVVSYSGRGYAESAWARAADAVTRAAMRQAVGRARAICPDGVPVVAVTTEATGLPVAEAGAMPVADLRLDELVGAVAAALADARERGSEGVSEGGSEGLKTAPENRAENAISLIAKPARYSTPPTVALADVAKRLPRVSARSVQVWLSDAVEAGLVVRSGSARATRYGLPVVAAEPRMVAAPVDTRGPADAPSAVPVVAVSVAPAKPATVHVVPAEPVARPLPVSRAAPPPVVVESPPGPDWLADAVSPSRHSDELLALRCFMSGPYADQVGHREAWREETTPLVRKLHRAATVEARRRGQPPPPVELVAGHTVSWYAAAAG